ncbi:ferritin-like domain-containing protein [Candidatus Atelocyanobacterium thalassae]|nr:ferritin-like domain-containing protein [Candidatus Atelocyanobacterium thalassa]MCH2543498.1 bacterioferritin [Candidatus Atelocyanobacterium sp. ALOHA_A2.5_9]|tara:strand:+ start:2365 stop:2802 length:438 start_codon:yes stop_codon:yes gene_type:complete
MRTLNRDKTNELLNTIMEYELAGVVRYTHYSLMVTGPHRIPIVQFFQQQATESLLHAQQVGEILTGLEGHPSLKIAQMEESNEHTLHNILVESLNHEKKALDLYKDLLEVVEGASVYIEEFTRGMIGQEEVHNIELKKMLRDYVS